jgi:hypothetical protein
MTSTNLALQKYQSTRLWYYVAPKLCQQEIYHVYIALVDLWVMRLMQAFCRLCACLSGAENISQKFHDYSLRRGDDVFGPAGLLATITKVHRRDAYSDSLNA